MAVPLGFHQWAAASTGDGVRETGLATVKTSRSGVKVEPGSRRRMRPITRSLSRCTIAVSVRTPRAVASVDELQQQLAADADALPGVLDEDRELGGRGVGGGAVVPGDPDDLPADERHDGLAQVVVDGHEPRDGVGREAVHRGVEAAVDGVG